jgi:hypothetical protein
MMDQHSGVAPSRVEEVLQQVELSGRAVDRFKKY